MRWRHGMAVVAVVLAVAACGGGKKSTNTAAATGSSSTISSASAGSSAPEASGSASAASSTASGGDAPVVASDQGPGGSQGGTSTTDAPVPPGRKPFAGRYTYQVTGQGSPTQAVTTTEDLNDTDQRNTIPAAGPMGEQIQVLRFLDDRVDLVSLQMKGGFPKTFNGPVQYVPVPGAVGQTWAWDLTSTDGLTHVHQASRIDRTESVSVGGQAVDTFVAETDITISGDVNATGHLTTWASPVYKLAVRNHSTLKVTTPAQFSSDITTDLLDLRPS